MRTRRSINRRNWLDLPDEVTAKILMKLGPIEILLTAQRVCQSWRKICKEDSSMWRRIELNDSMCNEMKMWRRTFKASYPIWKNSNSFSDSTNLWMMCCQAIERSRDGQLIDIDIDFFGLGSILPYIAKRSSGLKRLRLVSCFNISNKGLIQFSPKFPLLEELELTNLNFSKEALEAVGKSCPLLRSFKLNFARPIFRLLYDSPDDQALAIAETMPGLRHLELFGNALTYIGLYAILNGCPHIAKRSSCLKRLRLVSCYNISNKGLIQFSPKIPLLEELELTNLSFSKEALEAVGKSCPLLRSFKLNFVTPIFRFLNHSPDDQALAIAETMPGLRHLELFGNALTNIGLYAILNGCPHLESLDLRECIHISARYDDLKHQIKSLKLGHVGL